MKSTDTSITKWLSDHEDGWKAWSFKEDLRLEVAKTGKPSGGDRRSGNLTEEGVETLLMLNLDQLFPYLSLRLAEKQLGSWAGADISAVDPMGRRHVFEVKHGASARDVVDQAVAYGFQGLTQRTVSWFDEQENRELVIAARQAGFWSGQRVQTISLSDAEKQYPPRYRTKAIYEKLTGNPATFDDMRELARPISQSLNLPPAWKRNANSDAFRVASVQMHMVVPYADKIEDYALNSLRRLVSRGLYATIWEMAIDFDEASRTGHLWLKPYDVLADSHGHGADLEETGVDEGNAPTSSLETHDPGSWFVGVDEILCQMALQPSGLEVLRSDWNHFPSEGQVITQAWPHSDHRQSLEFRLRVRGPAVKCEIRASRTGWIWDHPDEDVRKQYRKRVRKRRRYIAEWLTSVLEFGGHEGAIDPFEPFKVSKPESWGFADATNDEHVRTVVGGHPVDAHHPSQMFAASFTMNVVELGVAAVARVCADALAQFREIAGTACYDTDAFGPFEEVSPF